MPEFDPESEYRPLLPSGNQPKGIKKYLQSLNPRRIVAIILTVAFLVATFVLLALYKHSYKLSDDPLEAAHQILGRHPAFDTHIDLPWLVRFSNRYNATAIDLTHEFKGHLDIPRLKTGRVGGFFWSVFTSCPKDTGVNFTKPTNSVRDTLEQIDVSKALIAKYSDVFAFATSTSDIKRALKSGKVASLLGIEGGHQLGNSLAALRQFAALGVRYVTLTHSCNNDPVGINPILISSLAFADSAGIFETPKPAHGGLSPFGATLVRELNRLGVLVDLSHTADTTAVQALLLSEAPVIWSHSSARSVWDVPRNVPDEILKLIGEGPGLKDAVVQVNFAPYFVAAPGNATVSVVADHVEHIGKVAGRRHVGIGSDYDGIETTPKGLEDVSKYPNLFAELYRRGWSEEELAGLAGENFYRVFKGAEETAARLQKEGRLPEYAIYDKRTDL